MTDNPGIVRIDPKPIIQAGPQPAPFGSGRIITPEQAAQIIAAATASNPDLAPAAAKRSRASSGSSSEASTPKRPCPGSRRDSISDCNPIILETPVKTENQNADTLTINPEPSLMEVCFNGSLTPLTESEPASPAIPNNEHNIITASPRALSPTNPPTNETRTTNPSTTNSSTPRGQTPFNNTSADPRAPSIDPNAPDYLLAMSTDDLTEYMRVDLGNVHTRHESQVPEHIFLNSLLEAYRRGGAVANMFINRRPSHTNVISVIDAFYHLLYDTIQITRTTADEFGDEDTRIMNFMLTEEMGASALHFANRVANANRIYAQEQSEQGRPTHYAGYVHDLASMNTTLINIQNTFERKIDDLGQIVLNLVRSIEHSPDYKYPQTLEDIEMDRTIAQSHSEYMDQILNKDISTTGDDWGQDIQGDPTVPPFIPSIYGTQIMPTSSTTTLSTQPTLPTPIPRRPTTLTNPPALTRAGPTEHSIPPVPNRPVNPPNTLKPLPGPAFPRGPHNGPATQAPTSTISSFGIHNSFDQNKPKPITKLPSGPTDLADPPAGPKKSFAKAAAAGSSGNDGFTTVGPKGKAKAKTSSQPGLIVVSKEKIANAISQNTKCDTQFMINYGGKGPLKGKRIEPRHIQNTLQPIFAKHAPNLVLRVSKYNFKGNLILTFKYGANLEDFIQCVPHFRTFLNITDDTRIYDNVQWSKIHVTRVPTGVEFPDRNYARFSEQDLLHEMLEIDPLINRLKITQGPRWITKATNLHKELSSFVFAFHDPDGSLLNKVLNLKWYMFGSEVTPLEWQDKPLLKGCSRCLSLEHDTEGCRNAFRCNRCGGAHSTNNHNKHCTQCIKEDVLMYQRCSHAAKCVHCSGPHPSSDSTCPTKAKFRLPFAQTIARNFGVPTGSRVPTDHNLQPPIIGGTTNSVHAPINVHIDNSRITIPGVPAPTNDGSKGAASFANADGELLDLQYGTPTEVMLALPDVGDAIMDDSLFDPPSSSL
ncbi:hypothetical protein FRC09_013305 [Ceratobasidium sp. 395]|nr:hypothetical protein FRC09_013305 [Ceratobasidium sp. 395]